jgi:hypothetical protein
MKTHEETEKEKSIFQKIKELWTEPKPTDQEIKVYQMMNVLFDGQTTGQVICTLILFDEKTKARLKEIKEQAETDKLVTDSYLRTNPSKKVTI